MSSFVKLIFLVVVIWGITGCQSRGVSDPSKQPLVGSISDSLISNGFFKVEDLESLKDINRRLKNKLPITDSDIDFVEGLLSSGPVDPEKVKKIEGNFKENVLAFLQTRGLKKLSDSQSTRIFDMCQKIASEKNEKVTILCLLIMRSTGDSRFPDFLKTIKQDKSQPSEVLRVAEKMKDRLSG